MTDTSSSNPLPLNPDTVLPLSQCEEGTYQIEGFDPTLNPNLKLIFLTRGWIPSQTIQITSKGTQTIVMCRQHQVMMNRTELNGLLVKSWQKEKTS